MASLTPEDWVLQGLRITAMVVYAIVGIIVLRRRPMPDARLANLGFALWWLGLAALGVLSIPAGFGWNLAEQGLVVWRLWIYLLIPMIYVALAGLLYYLLYLYTGRRAIYRPVAAFYLAMTGYLVWLVEGGRPFLTTDEAGQAMVDFADPIPEWATLLWSVLLVLPVLAAAVAYGVLFFRTHDREARFRIALVASAIILWFSFSLINTVLGFGSEAEASFVEQAISQSLGLLAAVMTLFAFAPPPPVRRWLHAGRMPQAVAG